MADFLAGVEFGDASVDLLKLPFFGLDIRGYCFSRQENFDRIERLESSSRRFFVPESIRIESVSLI